MNTDQPGACMSSQAWANRDVTRLHAKREVQVKCNTSTHQAIIDSLPNAQLFCQLKGYECIG